MTGNLFFLTGLALTLLTNPVPARAAELPGNRAQLEEALAAEMRIEQVSIKAVSYTVWHLLAPVYQIIQVAKGETTRSLKIQAVKNGRNYLGSCKAVANVRTWSLALNACKSHGGGDWGRAIFDELSTKTIAFEDFGATGHPRTPFYIESLEYFGAVPLSADERVLLYSNPAL